MANCELSQYSVVREVVMIRLLPCIALLACAGTEGTDTGAQNLPQPAPLMELSNGSCPSFATTGAEVTFTSADVERKVRAYLPGGDTTGAPLLFVWHPLGVSASQIAQWNDLQTLATDTGAVILVPSSQDSNMFDWEFVNESTTDIVLYDDLRTCAADQLGIDVRRVYTTGMSAGGLWSTYLTMHRADTLAASLIMSGGTDPVVTYESPDADIPVLMFYGGDNDTWSGGGFSLDFQQATLAFADDIKEDVETVILCNHEGGHTLPPSNMGTVQGFLLKHAYGERSPFADGDLTGLPSSCQAVE